MPADGRVVVTAARDGRILDTRVLAGEPFIVEWDGQLLDADVLRPRGEESGPHRRLTRNLSLAVPRRSGSRRFGPIWPKSTREDRV